MPSRKKMFKLLVDDLSRYMWLILLEAKDQTAVALVTFQQRAKAEVGRRLGTLRTDRGGEFTARTFIDHCAKEGVQWHFTALYTTSKTAWWRGGTRRSWGWPGA
jgi:hypothetical protein